MLIWPESRAALGAEHRLIGVSRLRAGSKKGVYRLTFDNDSTVIVYIWDDTENYWPSGQADEVGNHANPLSPASGASICSRPLTAAWMPFRSARPGSTWLTGAGTTTRQTSRWSKMCPARPWRRCSARTRAA